MEVAAGDGITEKYGDSFPVCTGQIQDDADARFGLLRVQKEVVNNGIVFGNESRADGGMAHEGVQLGFGEVPDSIDLLALQDALGEVGAQGAVSETGELGQVPQSIVVTGFVIFHGDAPFFGVRSEDIVRRERCVFNLK